MSTSAHRPRRSRPVADAPVLDGHQLAKAWLVELVAVAPLERAAATRRPTFAAEAPRLCAAVSAALASDAALEDLGPDGALAALAGRAAALAGAAGTADVLAAIEALRGIAWDAILDALDRPVPAQVAELADRLGAVMATLSVAALDAVEPRERGPLAAVLRPDYDVELAVESPEEPSAAAAPFDVSVLRDLEEAGTVRGASVIDLGHGASGPTVEDASGFRHARVAPWTAAIERRLARHRGDGLPFAVLCLEVADLDRLVAAAPDGGADAMLDAAEAAVCAQLRPADALVREQAGRLWLTAPDTDAASARALAHRIAAAVAEVPARHAALEVAVGVAVCPSDGADAAHLEARAENGLFAARAAGVRVASSRD
jgi:GGDEF domain-containing protein